MGEAMIVPRVALLLAAWLATAAAGAAELPRAAPDAVGLSAERLGRLAAVLSADTASHVIPGAVLLVARHGKVAYFEAFGVRDPASQAPMTTDAIFRIYSMSKPITSVAAMMLWEDARFTLDEPIAKYLPMFAEPQVGVEQPGAAGAPPTLELVAAKKPITVHDLMRHSSGLTYGFFGDLMVKKAYVAANLNADDPTLAEFVARLAKLPLAFQPGTTWDYSQSTDVLGRLIEVIAGTSLYEFERAHLLAPLGMVDTGFAVTDPAKQGRVAEPFDADRTIGAGARVGDPRQPRKMESGGGGMVGTAMDYARFAQMLLNGGTLDGRRYLGPRTVAYMTSDHLGSAVVPGPYYLPGPAYGFGLGFAVRRLAGVAPYAGSPGDYTWGGAGGTYFWVDPKTDLVVVFMMQSPKHRVHYRTIVRDLVYAAVTE
jgi:CubicO group peptidase (beta-lactamase class C family)